MSRRSKPQKVRVNRKRAGAGDTASVAALQRRAQQLYEAGRRREALDACRQLLAIEAERADVQHIAGSIALELGDFVEAAKLCRSAVTLKPDFAEAHLNLGKALDGLGRRAKAIAACRRAAELRPDMAPAHNSLGNLLLANGSLDAAAAAYRRVLELAPDAPPAWRNLGMVLHRLGGLDEAVSAFRRALALQPDWLLAYNNLVMALLEQGEAAAAVAACDDWLAVKPGDTEALAFKCAALNEAGAGGALAELLDFDRLVGQVRLAPPPGFADLAEFNAALAEHVLAHPTLQVPPKDDPTYHHDSLMITRELLAEPKGPVAHLEAMMARAVTGYLDGLGEDQRHPFLANRPRRWRLSSWGVVLNGQGNLLPHIHMDGYMGGVYYVRLPDVVGADRDDQAGWFELGRPVDELSVEAEPVVRAIRPEAGLMLLFPAYMYHRTVPFRSAEKRISIAFDMVAED